MAGRARATLDYSFLDLQLILFRCLLFLFHRKYYEASLGLMQSHILRLDTETSKSIQASLVFPTLTSIILGLVYFSSLQAKPISRIQLFVHLGPEWQVTCEFDQTGRDGLTLDRCFAVQGGSLEYLSHLGILDIQRGQHKLVQKVSSSFYFILCRYTNKTHVSCLLTQLHQGDNVIFSGTIKKEVSNVSQLDSTITLRDIFRNVRDVKNPACYTS